MKPRTLILDVLLITVNIWIAITTDNQLSIFISGIVIGLVLSSLIVEVLDYLLMKGVKQHRRIDP